MTARALVLGRPYDLSEAPYDGFVDRHRRLLTALAQHAEIVAVTLRPVTDASAVSPRLPAELLCDLPISLAPSDRGARIRRLLPGPVEVQEWDEQLAEVVRRTKPDVAITLGPWLDEEYRAVYDAVPTVHVYEEDLTRMAEIAPQSLAARALRRADLRLRRPRVARPAAVVVIADQETRFARRRFGPKTPVHVIPQTLDPGRWPAAREPANGSGILCIGALQQPRNGEGLAALLHALAATGRNDVPITLISGGGLTADVEQLVARLPQVSHEPRPGDAYDAYRASCLAVVPAMRTTGMKATVLQGWASGCAVAAYRDAGNSVGRMAPKAVALARSPADLAAAVVGLWDDTAARQRLALAGMSAFRDHFNDQLWLDTFVDLVLTTARSATR